MATIVTKIELSLTAEETREAVAEWVNRRKLLPDVSPVFPADVIMIPSGSHGTVTTTSSDDGSQTPAQPSGKGATLAPAKPPTKPVTNSTRTAAWTRLIEMFRVNGNAPVTPEEAAQATGINLWTVRGIFIKTHANRGRFVRAGRGYYKAVKL